MFVCGLIIGTFVGANFGMIIMALFKVEKK